MADAGCLEDEFNQDMHGILEREGEVGLHSTRFRQMIEQHQGLTAAKLLLKPEREFPPNTFSWLREIGRLDLTMEFYVVQDKYRSLFSSDEREIARWRLDHGD